MQKLINELDQEKMTINSWYSKFESHRAIAGGLMGALVGAANEWYCSLDEEYFYYFKIKNLFSYKGIKKDTIKKIKLNSITKLTWKPKSFQGLFTIEYIGGKISGILSGDATSKTNFKAMLKYIQEKCQVPVEGYFYQKTVNI